MGSQVVEHFIIEPVIHFDKDDRKNKTTTGYPDLILCFIHKDHTLKFYELELKYVSFFDLQYFTSKINIMKSDDSIRPYGELAESEKNQLQDLLKELNKADEITLNKLKYDETRQYYDNPPDFPCTILRHLRLYAQHQFRSYYDIYHKSVDDIKGYECISLIGIINKSVSDFIPSKPYNSKGVQSTTIYDFINNFSWSSTDWKSNANTLREIAKHIERQL